MSDLTRAHQHPHAPQPQPQQPLGHHHPQPLPHHLHHYGGGNGAANANTTTPTLAHANKRYVPSQRQRCYGVSVPPVVLGNSTHDAPSPYGSAMYGSLYAHQQALKDRMEYAFHQQQQQQQYNGGSQQSHGQPSQGNQGYYANPAAYSMQQDAGLSFGVQDTASQQPQAPPPHHHSLGMPQLPEMQLPPQHHDGNKDVDGVRKFRPLGGSMYLGSPSVYGTTTGADQRTTATTSASDSYMSSIRYQHQQQQQQQQQQNIGAYRPMMHSYNAQATSQPSSHGSTTTSTFYANQTSRLSHQAPDLMTPAMAAAATAVAHGLRSAGVGSSTPTLPQNISARLTREMDNTVRIQNSQQSVQVAAVNNHQQHQHQPQQQQPPQQQQQQPQQQPQQSQPQQQQDVVCSFCYGPQCDRVAEGCGHRFHQGCLQAWGEKSFTCPLCIGSQNQMKAVTPTNGSYSQMPQNQSSMQGYQGTSLDLSGARGSADLPPTPASSALAAAARQRSRVQQRPPPIDTTRSLDSMPVSKINISNNSNVSTPGGGQTTPSSGTVSRPTSATSSSGSVDGKRSSRSKGKKPLKECSIPGCGRTVRSRGLCKGHGGGRRCGFPGCGLSDQGGGFCISHGGGKRCQFESCENSAQSRGLCKLHGGGSRCTVPNCTKSSQGRGLCRAHGGGRRCMIEGCNKTDRRAGYCVTHGADKKCVVPECSKTGRIDGMCTKHYFERNQAVLASQAQHAMMAAAAANKASRDELRNKKKAAPKPGAGRSKTSQLTPATSPTTPSLLNSLNAVSLLSSATAASAATVGGGMHGDTASGGLGLDI